jgi:hypothetical protein
LTEGWQGNNSKSKERFEMNTYIEYKLENGTFIQVLAPAGTQAQGPVEASSLDSEQVIQAEKTFDDAIEGALKSASALLKKVKTQKADEIELTFGLLTTGELGNFAIGKVGVEASYEITLKLKNKKEESEKL